jgi:hypothetical protein
MATRFEPSIEQRRLVEGYASCHAKIEDIRQLVINPNTGKPISLNTLYSFFEEELDRGRARTNIKIGKFLSEVASGNRQADKSQVTAAIFWAKCHMGWRQTDRMELTGANGAPLVLGARDILQSKIDRLTQSSGENVVPFNAERARG